MSCESWNYHSCRYYAKFLSILTMESICWNKNKINVLANRIREHVYKII